MLNNDKEYYIGLMSGTSLDGIDAVLINAASEPPRLCASHFQPFPADLKATLLELHTPATGELHRSQLASNELAKEYAQAIHELLNKQGLSPNLVRAIGCHGQTIRHRPEHGYTIQLVNAALLAELTGITVVHDFRSRDIAAGGQGAPLVPAFHDQVLRHPTEHRVILNIGGISNLTDLAPGKPTIGFDCGPGNLLMDAWIAKHKGAAYDQDGNWARSGTLIPALLAKMLDEPFFDTAPPKSSGRDLFNMHWLEHKLNGDEAPEDVQSTLLALTSRSISAAIQRYCSGAELIYLCGGGAHNSALSEQLATQLSGCLIQKTDDIGIGADWMEAIAFAWLAQQTLNRRPANLPAVTGARHPCILGSIHPA